MGVDFSHGEAHFGHGSFRSFRQSLASMVGVRLSETMGFGGKIEWETLADPIAPLLSGNDAGGEMTPEGARGAAARLEELMADERNREENGGCQWEELLAGLKEAAEAGESFVIME